MGIKGTVQAVKKDKKGLLVNDQWYSNAFLKEDLKCQKGDEVEVTLNDKNFLSSVEILKASPKGPSTMDPDIRNNVDAGNLMRMATDLLCAGKAESVKVAALELTAAFREVKKELSKGDDVEDQ